MKSLFALLLFLSGILPQLLAQDIHPAPLVWINCEENPDELPVARGIPSMEISDGLEKLHEPAYAEYRLYVSEKGRIGVWDTGYSSPWFPVGFHQVDRDFIPAKRKGKAVACEVALHLIYNPAEADPKSPDAIPRLLAILPPIYPANANPPQGHDPVIRVKASIDAQGVVIASQALPDQLIEFAEAAAGAVRSWQFAPARKGGQPVAADLEVSVVFQEPLCRKSEADFVKPKPVDLIDPKYPSFLKQAGFSGEVDVTYVVNVEGRVTEVVANKSTHPAFEDTALRAVKEWRFVPATIHGQPVSSRAMQRIVFTLDDNGYMGFKVNPPKSFPKDLPEQFQFDVAPKLEQVALPVYPLEDLKAQRSGKVTLAYVIGPEGRVDEVKVLPGAPSASLAAAAAAALEQFRFTPPGRKGKPCSALLKMELEFSPDGISGNTPVTEGTKRALHILEKSPEKLTKASALDQKLKRRSGLPPKPAPANSARGVAVVEFVVDRDGIPQLPHVVSADAPSLGYAACQAIAAWRFERPKSAGKYVDVLVRAPFEFK